MKNFAATFAMLGAALCACSLSSSPAMAQLGPRHAEELRAQIVRSGTLRVIVTLALDEQQSSTDAAAIRLKQQELLAALKGRGEHEVVFVFPSAPLVALIVGPSALEVLLSSPLVKAITVDAARRATPSDESSAPGERKAP